MIALMRSRAAFANMKNCLMPLMNMVFLRAPVEVLDGVAILSTVGLISLPAGGCAQNPEHRLVGVLLGVFSLCVIFELKVRLWMIF